MIWMVLMSKSEEIVQGPLLLTWFNLDPNMDK